MTGTVIVATILLAMMVTGFALLVGVGSFAFLYMIWTEAETLPGALALTGLWLIFASLFGVVIASAAGL